MNRRTCAILHGMRALGLAVATLSAGEAVAQGEIDGNSNQSRHATVSVDLDAQGLVASCVVTASSGIKELDDYSCKAVREQGRYEAVLDDDGKPIPATIIHTLTFRVDDEAKGLADREAADKGRQRNRKP